MTEQEITDAGIAKSTGRIVGVSKEFKEGNHIENPISYMTQPTFSKVFGNVEFKKQNYII